MQPWFTVYFFDIGHPCYDRMTPVKTRYPLTSITWPYRGLKFTAHRGQVFFEVDLWSSAGFLTGLRVHAWLTYWKQGRIVRKPVNINPGLNINQFRTFSSFQMFCCFLLCIQYVAQFPATLVCNRPSFLFMHGNFLIFLQETVHLLTFKT